MEAHTIPGIPTHRAVDAISTYDYNGPETKSLQMPLHAATLFDEAVAAELKETVDTMTSPSREDLTAGIQQLGDTACTKQAELTSAKADPRKQQEDFAEEEYRLAVIAAANDGAVTI